MLCLNIFFYCIETEDDVSLTSILIQFCASLCTIWLLEQFSICLLIQHTCITNVWSISLKYICHTEGEGEAEEFKDLYFGHDGAEDCQPLQLKDSMSLNL